MTLAFGIASDEICRRIDGIDADIAECRENLEALLRERLALMNKIAWRDVLEAFREELKQDRPHPARSIVLAVT